MGLSQIQKIQLNKQVDHILHVPSNMPLGNQNQLEMAFVIDCSSDREFIEVTMKDAISGLKAHDILFQNVRSNVIYWKNREEEKSLETEVMPMSFIQMGRPFENTWERNVDKRPYLDDLCAYLKMYHARSKCILVFTDGIYEIEDREKVKESLNPFLKSKLLFITPDNFVSGLRIYMEMLS